MSDIAILLPDLRGGGAERVNLSLAREFKRLGYSVEFVVMRAEGELFLEARADFNVVSLEAARVRGLPFSLIRYLRKNKPKVLLASMWPLTAVAPACSRIFERHCKVVVVEHGMLSAQYSKKSWHHSIVMKLSLAIGYRLAHARVGVSKGVSEDMAFLSRMNKDLFNTIHNPVPPTTLKVMGLPARAAEFWADGYLKVLSVGSFKAVKNHAMLLNSFARLALHQRVRLVVLGEGDLRAETEQLAVKLGIDSEVLFPGFFNDPAPFYQHADLFVLSSNNEGLPTVIVEALSSGIAVVSTDCPSGPAEILDNGKYGTLVPVGDEIALAEAMQSALFAGHDPERLRARARDFAPEVSAARYLELLK